MNYLPTNIKYLRTRDRISQQKLGIKIGCDVGLPNCWEHDVCKTQLNELLKLSDYFKVSIDWLVRKDLMRETYPMIKANYQLTKQILETYD